MTVTQLESKLADLHAEQAGIGATIAAARQAGDGDAWMKALTREELLPVEIDGVRRELLPLQLDATWEATDQLLAAEAARKADLDKAQATLDKLSRPAKFDPESAARRAVAVLEAGKVIKAAAEEWNAARDAAGWALLRIDDLESEIEQLTGVHPAADIDGPRGRVPVLTGTVILVYGHYGALDSEIDSDRAPRTQLVGTRPQRWVAHRLDPHVFKARKPHGPTPEELAEAEARRAADAVDPRSKWSPRRVGPAPANAGPPASTDAMVSR